MSRIRTIKPEWRTDQKLARAGLEARVLSVALITLADDEGRGVWREPVMAVEVFGFDANPSRLLREGLARLSGWFLEVYRVRGEDYFQIINWSTHQKVDKKTASRIPPMSERDPDPDPRAGSTPEKPTESPIRENLASDSREPREDVASGSVVPRENLAPGPWTMDHGPRTMDQHVSTSAAPPPEQSAPPPEPPSRGKPRSDVLEVFEYWRSKLRKSAATQLDGKRRKRIEWALRTYGLETVKRCIDGYAGSAWHRGENDRHKPFDDLELWLRDAKHVEEGLGYALGDGARRSRGALPPSAIDADSAAESQRRAAEILGPSLFGVGT